ncbi:phage antirepressor KilAC domain-containing protein [Lactococcus fujiensis]|uniref:Phage antirepressor protein n=1 Tax=Lactococcus fujiensis JCM 16395 TaxID=1291764 RepID=A0A2A5RJ01_9LACT|nr:phage antirepressor KilAC domain-containing protein [Lactococcus fujiensis]PCR99079.1 phage antirepressor protein [Lactococcus fujiensis JCM 16395]
MNELIKITSNNNDEQVVSARDLHKFLEVKERYSTWFDRMVKYGFIENSDYIGCKVFNTLAKQELQDHIIKLDMAKEISMIQRNDKGKEARQYFIQVERFWNSPEMVTKRALEYQQKKIKQLESKNAEMAPKALFADSVAASHTSILVGDLAKLIKQNGYDIGQNRLFVWLRENGWLISRKGELYNSPTQKGMNKEFFEIKERVFNNPDGTVHIKKTTKVTGKGQIYFVNKFLQNTN